jgi:hypothetical protein
VRGLGEPPPDRLPEQARSALLAAFRTPPG